MRRILSFCDLIQSSSCDLECIRDHQAGGKPVLQCSTGYQDFQCITCSLVSGVSVVSLVAIVFFPLRCCTSSPNYIICAHKRLYVHTLFAFRLYVSIIIFHEIRDRKVVRESCSCSKLSFYTPTEPRVMERIHM